MGTVLELALANGPTVLLVAALLFFGKSIVRYFFSELIEIKKQELQQNLEVYKSNLTEAKQLYQLSLDEKLEEHKNKLDILRNEYNVKFSHLHIERAEIVKNVYRNLVELQSAMFTFTRSMHPIINDMIKEEEQRVQNVENALNTFNRYYL